MRILKHTRHSGGVAALIGTLAGALALPGAAWSQAWPAKPPRVVVPYVAGGIVDIMARTVAGQMSQDLGQALIVEPRPGAGGNVGAEQVARSKPDGYTLLVSASFLLNNPLLEKDLRWQVKDFAPVARFTLAPSFVLVNAALPAKSLKEFVAYAKSRPGIPVAGSGGGSPPTMAIHMFASVAKFDMNLIEYNGAPPQIPPLMTGEISMGIINSLTALSALKSGKVRALANTSDKRSPLLPEVPTVTEAGFPEMTVVSWYGFHVPAGTPRDVITRIAAATDKATQVEEVRKRTMNSGGETAYLGPADFEKFLAEDLERWQRFAKVANK